jgi:hypothetical protein
MVNDVAHLIKRRAHVYGISYIHATISRGPWPLLDVPLNRTTEHEEEKKERREK